VNDHPSLYLSPAREEQVLDNPPITIFHDVITNAEANQLTKLAQAKVKLLLFVIA
jgi:hypothetical protein